MACRRLMNRCVDRIKSTDGIDAILGGVGFDAYANMRWWEQELIALGVTHKEKDWYYWQHRFPKRRL